MVLIRFRQRLFLYRLAPPWRGAGVTLVELVVVVVLIGLALTYALPGYQLQVLKANRQQGVAMLQALVANQERFRTQHGRYAQDFTELGYADNATSINTRGRVVSQADPQRIYTFELATSGRAYEMRATPQLGQQADTLCGTVSFSSIGHVRVSGFGSVERCW